jgi:5-methylthioribose kinase
MFLLNKENVIDYVKNKTNLIDFNQIPVVTEIGDGEADNDGDGYVNFLFRIKTHKISIIIKQARSYLKAFDGYSIPVNRNKLEYETLKLRNSIVPQYIPNIYFVDHDSNIFIMEDVSHLNILRFQLNNMNTFYNFPKQCAEYLATSNFYTSEFFLDTHTYRNLLSSFINSEMRKLMENVAFIRGYFGLDYSDAEQNLILMSDQTWSSDKVVLECYKLRDIFIKKSECLIHGDLHTSNIFVGQNEIKIIDMEYTFMGPASFDMGYLLANFISQYAATSFKPYAEKNETTKFKNYLLASIKGVYEYYIDFYNSYWNKDAKDEYKKTSGFKEYLYMNLLHEMLGFAACSNIARITSFASFPDFDVIPDSVLKNHARRLSLILSQNILLNRTNFNKIDDVIKLIISIERTYKNSI